jgi:molybdopterin converting factor small subunit
MNKVRLQLYSWISPTLGMSGSGNHTLEQEINEGMTISSLLTKLADSYPEFRKLVFDPDKDELSSEVLVIINNRLLQVGEIKDTKINNNDTIILAPVLSGG